jgi:hypothetical protein
MKVLATALAGILYAIGWLAGIIAVAVKWLWSAIAVGWDDAHTFARRDRTPAPSPELRSVPPWPAERAN